MPTGDCIDNVGKLLYNTAWSTNKCRDEALKGRKIRGLYAQSDHHNLSLLLLVPDQVSPANDTNNLSCTDYNHDGRKLTN